VICSNTYVKSNCIVEKTTVGASYELENGSMCVVAAVLFGALAALVTDSIELHNSCGIG
jgi:hypothetical protein